MRLIISITCLAVCLAVAASKVCNSADDCGEGKCCVVSSSTLSRRGRCLKLGRNRARCNKPGAKLDYYDGKFSKFCPCEEGLECDTGKVEKGFGRCKSPGGSTARPDEPEETPEPDDKPDEPEEPEEPEVKPEEPEVKPEEPEEPEVKPEEPEEPEVNPEEPEAGPGGEKPRDDDCADWELPC